MREVLEAPCLTEDVETGEIIPSDFPGRREGEGFSAIRLGQTASFFFGETFGDSSAVSPPRRSFFPLPRDRRMGAAPLEAEAVTSPYPARSTPLRIPASPGAAVLEEFEPLYHKYQRRVYRQCYRMLGNQEDAEDLTQEVFLQLYRKAHTFRGDANFSTWLYRLTVNTVLMQLRRHRRWHEGVISVDVAPGSDEALSDTLTMMRTLPDPAAATLDKICVDTAVAQLSSGYKEIFLLHDLEGYRHDEIAKLLGISEGTSKSQLHKARLRLRALIGSNGGKHAGCRLVPTVGNAHKKRCFSSRPAECVPA